MMNEKTLSWRLAVGSLQLAAREVRVRKGEKFSVFSWRLAGEDGEMSKAECTVRNGRAETALAVGRGKPVRAGRLFPQLSSLNAQLSDENAA
jgi:hypothetical protein